MIKMVDHALALAAIGLPIFPIKPGEKEPPRFTAFWKYATTDPAIINRWWHWDPDANVGINCREHLGLDVDVKKGLPGIESLNALPPLPATYWQRTPSGGFHFLFRLPPGVTLGNTHHKLGKGLDTRGVHGYLLGAGSKLVEGVYTGGLSTPIAGIPAWLLEQLQKVARAEKGSGHKPFTVDQTAAVTRGIKYLEGLSPAAPGERGICCYKAACVLRGFGLDMPEATFLILEHFKADPPPPPEELETAVRNAYRYAKGTQGDAAAETVFAAAGDTPPPPPGSDAGEGAPDDWFENLNKKYAFCIVGNQPMILHERANVKGRSVTDVWPVATFHAHLKPQTIEIGKQRKQVSHLWLGDPFRKAYEDLVFVPGKTVGPEFYNLWKGFSYQPLAPGEVMTPVMKRGMDAFLEHTLQNFCEGNVVHHRWFMGWCAQLIQRPWEKPLVALVVRGLKGCGKDTPINIVGSLFRPHFLSTAKKRYLVGDFNGHMQNLLMISLNEAFWAYDPQVKSTMNDLITGYTHFIERKGCEPYEVDNYLRIVLLGNADQTVPATYDERRYTIFNCGNGRLRDKKFFETMRLDMEVGAARALLRYLLDFDLSTIDVNEPLETQGLYDQKLGNLDPVHRWWRECLLTGWVVGGGFGSTRWETRIDKESFRSAYRRWREENKVPGVPPPEVFFGRRMRECCPGIDGTQKRTDNGVQFNQYVFPSLDKCISEWNRFIKFEDVK